MNKNNKKDSKSYKKNLQLRLKELNKFKEGEECLLEIPVATDLVLGQVDQGDLDLVTTGSPQLLDLILMAQVQEIQVTIDLVEQELIQMIDQSQAI